MPDSTISNLSSLTGAGLAPNDIFALVDVSDTSMGAGGTNKKITRAELCTFDMGTITSSTPILNLAQTWNNSGVTFAGLKFNVTDTASQATSLLMDFQVGGVSRFKVDKYGNTTTPNSSIAGAFVAYWVGGYFQINNDTFLQRDGAGIFAQRNSTNAQTFRFYNSYTDASNGEWGEAAFISNTFKIGTRSNGTGVGRNLQFVTADVDRIFITSAGHMLWNTDNTTDIGASGANRPRNIYVGNNVLAVNGFFVPGKSGFQSPLDGNITLYNNAATDFGLLQFGGNTSSFPALKRSGNDLYARLADDSGFAGLRISGLRLNAGSFIGNPSDGVFTLQNSGLTDFGRLQLGGTTNSFPAIKRVGTSIQFRAADDTGYVSIRSSNIQFTNGSFIYDQSNTGVITLSNNSATDFNRLQFGGTTSSFPALKRVNNGIHVRLADDSAYGYISGRVESGAAVTTDSLGFRGVPQNIQNADYTFVAEDSGKQIFHDEATPRTYTIPANASVAYDIGTTITIVNNTGAGNILLTSADTIRRGDGVSGTGSRTIGPDSMVTLLKTKATEWMITGAFY